MKQPNKKNEDFDRIKSFMSKPDTLPGGKPVSDFYESLEKAKVSFSLTEKDYFASYMKARLDDVYATWVRKNNEYTVTNNVFEAFEKAAAGLSLHDTREKVLWELMSKHLQSVKDDCEHNNLDIGKLTEKIGDIIVYLMLLEGMKNQHKR